MKISLNPHQMLAHWLPGFVILVIVYVDGVQNPGATAGKLVQFFAAKTKVPGSETLDAAESLLLFTVAAWTVGLFLDSLRNLLDEFTSERVLLKWRALRCKYLKRKLLKWCPPIKWKNMLKMKMADLNYWDNYWFSYFVFDANMAIGLFLLALLRLVPTVMRSSGKSVGLYPLWAVIASIVLLLDALCLRRDIKKILDTPENWESKGGGESGSKPGGDN